MLWWVVIVIGLISIYVLRFLWKKLASLMEFIERDDDREEAILFSGKEREVMKLMIPVLQTFSQGKIELPPFLEKNAFKALALSRNLSLSKSSPKFKEILPIIYAVNIEVLKRRSNFSQSNLRKMIGISELFLKFVDHCGDNFFLDDSEQNLEMYSSVLEDSVRFCEVSGEHKKFILFAERLLGLVDKFPAECGGGSQVEICTTKIKLLKDMARSSNFLSLKKKCDDDEEHVNITRKYCITALNCFIEHQEECSKNPLLCYFYFCLTTKLYFEYDYLEEEEEALNSEMSIPPNNKIGLDYLKKGISFYIKNQNEVEKGLEIMLIQQRLLSQLNNPLIPRKSEEELRREFQLSTIDALLYLGREFIHNNDQQPENAEKYFKGAYDIIESNLQQQQQQKENPVSNPFYQRLGCFYMHMGYYQRTVTQNVEKAKICFKKVVVDMAKKINDAGSGGIHFFETPMFRYSTRSFEECMKYLEEKVEQEDEGEENLRQRRKKMNLKRVTYCGFCGKIESDDVGVVEEKFKTCAKW